MMGRLSSSRSSESLTTRRPPPPLANAKHLARSPKTLILTTLALFALIGYLNHTSSPASLRRTRRIVTRRDPQWHDHSTIAAAVRPPSTQVAPTYLSHLAQYEVEPPFDKIYVVSAWLDTRPVLVQAAPEVVLVATNKGRPYFKYDINNYESNPLHCFFSIKPKGSSQTDIQSEWIYNQYICKLEQEDGTKVYAWEGAEIFVTLSLPRLDPPASSFLPVTPLPAPDPATHPSGHGFSAVCLPPITGDFYAPFLRDYVAHYRALGFSKFYPYLLDPGPETLRVLRELMGEEGGEGIEPVRWGVPKGWLFSTTRAWDTERSFSVAPGEWGVPGMEPLADEVEFGLGVPKGGARDVRLWYYGQGPSAQDCIFRAMSAGTRWVLSADLDEWLLLRPPHNHPWPPPDASPAPSLLSPPPANDLFASFARHVPPVLTQEWVSFDMPRSLVGLRDELMATGKLAAAYMFRSAFFCMTCRPGGGPAEGSGGRRAVEGAVRGGFEWERPGVEVPFAYSSPVRHEKWFVDGRRTKVVIDPWAWRITGIHIATMPYLQWALAAGPCALSPSPAPPRAPLAPSSFDPACAATFLRTFGPPTYLVDPGVEASNRSHSPAPVGHAQGGLWHVRVHPSLQEGLVEHGRRFEGREGAGREEGVELVEGRRVGPEMEGWLSQHKAGEFGNVRRKDPELVLLEDWTFVDVMGNVLAAMVEERRRRAKGGWGLAGGVVLVGVAVALVGVWWRRTKRRID